MLSTITSPIVAPEPAATAVSRDTTRANRAAALATLLNACRNAGVEPEASWVHEHDQLSSYAEINPGDDHLVIEAQVEPGTLGNGDGAYLAFLAFYALCFAVTWAVFIRPRAGRLAGV